MNRPIESHEPSAEFRSHLEWQIETALRRESRLAAPVTGRLRYLRSALAVVAALAIGGIAGIATGHAQDARERDRLVENARSDAALAQLRVELARADYQETRRRFDVGTADRETLAAAERQVRAMETALAKIRLDIEEIQSTSAAPRNDLQAPLVGQRDFVRDRLRLDLEQAQQALVAAEQGVARAKERVDVGVAPPAAHLQAEADVAQARARMERLRATMEMRQRALRGEIKVDELAASLRRMELTLQIRRTEEEMAVARRRIENVRRLVETGQASQLELKRAEVDLLEREVEMKRLRAEFERLTPARR